MKNLKNEELEETNGGLSIRELIDDIKEWIEGCF